MLLSLQIILLNLLTDGLLCLSYVPEIWCFVFIVSETKLSEKVTGKEKAVYKNRKGDPASISDGHSFFSSYAKYIMDLQDCNSRHL